MSFFKLKYICETYYLLLTIIYFTVVKNTWVFRKVEFVTQLSLEFNPIKFFLITGFVLFTIKQFKKTDATLFYKNLVAVFLFLDFIPSSIFYSSVKGGGLEVYFFHCILFYSFLFISRYTVKLPLPVLNKKQSTIILLLILLIGVLPFLRYIKNIDFSNLFLKNVYATRIKFRGLFDTYSGYTHSWFTRVLIPIIFVFSLKYKTKSIAILNMIILLFLYLLGAVKSVLLGSFLVVIFYYLPAKKFILYLGRSLVFLTIIALFISIFIIDDLNIVAVNLHRRLIFLPSLLDYCFFDFSSDTKLYWSNSFLRGFVDYPLQDSLPQLIGNIYFEKKEMGANNGLISDGYSNAGFLGVLVNIFIINIFMLVIKSCNIEQRFFGVYFFIILGFLSSALSAVLITHGGILLLILTVFILKNKK